MTRTATLHKRIEVTGSLIASIMSCVTVDLEKGRFLVDPIFFARHFRKVPGAGREGREI